MTLAQRLDLRQSQQLVMTPQLQQAIKLLQLSNLELVDYVDQAVEQNPLLERGEDDDSHSTEASPSIDQPPGPADGPPSPDGVGVDTFAASDHLGPAQDAPLDIDSTTLNTDFAPGDGPQGNPGDRETANAQDGAYLESWGPGGSSADGLPPDIGAHLADTPTLRDHLTEQIVIDLADPPHRHIALYLMEFLDDSGYFTGSEEDIARDLSVPVGLVGDTLARLQRLDPPGIFARTLKECLAIQLAAKDRLDPAMATLLDHLVLLGRREFSQLTRICGVDMEDMSGMVAEIRALDPRPAARFAPIAFQAVAPDILMTAKADGGWLIELNAETLPRVLVNRSYYREISRTMKSKADHDYLSDCLASATWLVKSLHQRQITILRVATEIVRQQDDFFRHGVQALKPLVLKDVADAIGMHESTVSRVTANKFMATPRGLFELKYFFTAAIQGVHGTTAHSAEAVRSRIKALIDGETPNAILSDDRIVEILRKDGVDIARRTVAKYREALKIPSSVQRRREKGMHQ